MKNAVINLPPRGALGVRYKKTLDFIDSILLRLLKNHVGVKMIAQKITKKMGRPKLEFPKQKIQVSLDPVVANKVIKDAKNQGLTQSEFMRRMVKRWYNNNK